jgi:choline dehydrogenase-like flavoprotein
MDVTYLPAALGAGAEIRAECFAHGFERESSGEISAVVYRHKGQDLRQRCKAVFLCAGAIETPRLLLHTGLANASGQVGRNFMAHVATQVWGTFPDEMRPNKGFPASLITEDMIRAADVQFAGGYITQSLGIVPVTWGMQVARGRGFWGQPLVDYLDRYNHVAGIGINGECLPHPDNRLELSSETDETGLPKPLIHFSYGENETRMSAHAERFMTQAWQAAGAADLWTFQRSAHTIGTCRMGTEPGSSVVDAAGRSHEIANLWIADNSVFPSALPANPALTIMALALRSADAFLHGRG